MVITLRNQKVILDSDVADLYDVQTKEINQGVRNNLRKFPEGYVFELTTILKSDQAVDTTIAKVEAYTKFKELIIKL